MDFNSKKYIHFRLLHGVLGAIGIGIMRLAELHLACAFPQCRQKQPYSVCCICAASWQKETVRSIFQALSFGK